ncbi:hypothetical protein OXPF_13390 [Oxobacter pfennigii]|uniref:DUF4264 domain-containing protein n=1 Tax=Oxobacter pfennigii TaxID=36849 RepID=A0A0P8YCI0_9CLOT|nr:DUF4264 family protein [Oxobacter pfennigii]KPU44861.1 hypothetical protein OXPF_13390 [Oxobacter pfennigii]
MEKEQLNVIGQKIYEGNPKLYEIVDFLNKSLKHKNLIFGMAIKDNKQVITIYEE